jgi:GPH family glycoside/pentoside/hexuronide:cation symporter
MSQALSPAPHLSFAEKLAFGCGNLFPTVVTATAGMAMFFYTDVVGLNAALIGTVLLLVRLVDAFWDIFVGRWVDRTRTRWGQCRPFLLFAAPVMALAFVLAYTVPPVADPDLRLVWVVAAYIALWWCYSLVNIPFQAMPAIVAPDPDERLRLLGVNAFVLFIFVVACGAGFPIMKDVLGADNPAQGFQRAALLFGGVGLLLTWLCCLVVKERVQTAPMQAPNLRSDFGALWGSRAWRACMVAFGLLALLIGLPLAAGVYYFTAVLKAPGLIGPFMGLSGIGLMVGVVLSDRLTRRYDKKQVLVLSSALMGLVSLGYLATMAGPPPAVFVLAFISNLMLGVGAPVSQSLLADTADAIELDSGRRVVGTLFATIGFAQKIGAGLSSALVGGVLSASGYLAGQAQQSDGAQWGIAALMGPVTGVIALLIAAVLGWGYPMGRADVARLRDALAARRAQLAGA